MSGHFLTEVSDQKEKATQVLSDPKAPRKYKVVLLNDDYTPMAFVVQVLRYFFHLSEALATQVMLQVHLQGRGVCGVFTREIAETKVALVNEYARMNEYPLLCSMEPE